MKLVAAGQDRPATLNRLRLALDDLKIEGITTNVPFLRRLLQHEAVKSGRTHTKFVEQNIQSLIAA
jgi:acetyl/propionyl-CoA carboxylase alpha subunit